MAITPAHFKKFIAGTTNVVPPTFDPTDGNAILWLNDTPCVIRDYIEFGLLGTTGTLGAGFDLSAGLDGGYLSSKICMATASSVPGTITVDDIEFSKLNFGSAQFGVMAKIPVWSKLTAAAWSGSMTYELFITASLVSGTARTIRARPNSALSFGSVSWTPVGGTPGACSTELRATLTVYDTGRVTVT